MSSTQASSASPAPLTLLLRLLALLMTLLLATPVRAERPRFEDEEMRRPTRPTPAVAMPQGWTLGQPVRFPRQLLPLLMGEREGGIVEPDDEPASVLKGLGLEPARSLTRSFGANRLTNDPTGDPPGAMQSENTLAAHGRFLATGWNDSFDPRTPRSFSGYGYSSDGGRTWHDGGILPVAGADDQLYGDPSLAVDDDGNFYYASLILNPSINFGVAVNRGRFVRDSLVFDRPVMASLPGVHDSFDKEWITVDPEDGTLYVSYTRFFDAGGDEIDLIRSRDHGRTWSAPVAVTDPASESVQGSRPAVGADGEVYVVYSATDLTDFSSHMRIRRSTSRGRGFGPPANVGEAAGDVGVYPNFVNGPPGFNRAGGVEFPSIAVDRGEGHGERHGGGDIYVAWNEAVDYFDDPLGGGDVVSETENNSSPATANAITLGATVVGQLDSATDFDWYSFTGQAGETVEFFLTPPQGAVSSGYLRLFGPGGGTADRLALCSFGNGQAFIVFTLPADGTYFIRPALLGGTTAKPGPYLLFTGVHVPNAHDVAADARDVMLSHSRDGLHWSRRVRVNDDPPRYDNAFAEVAVSRSGDVHLVWYDHRRDAQGGILTDLFHTRSRDGGRTFDASERVNDGPGVNWSLVPSPLAPNMGDYIALAADGDDVYAVWADGRLGTPDSWMMPVAARRVERHHGDDDHHDSSLLAASGAEDAAAVATSPALHVTNPSRAGAALAVSLDLPQAGDADLAIYSVTGQRVRTLYAGPVSAGTQRLTWDARGRDGAPVPPGLYFALLHSGATLVRQRIVMLR
jgi:hypothetical protein